MQETKLTNEMIDYAIELCGGPLGLQSRYASAQVAGVADHELMRDVIQRVGHLTVGEFVAMRTGKRKRKMTSEEKTTLKSSVHETLRVRSDEWLSCTAIAAIVGADTHRTWRALTTLMSEGKAQSNGNGNRTRYCYQGNRDQESERCV